MEDESAENQMVTLERRHKKEKKELQAQIQALKKAAKNDKTKKKELVSEIARLEAEQEEKHKNEMESLQIACEAIEISNEKIIPAENLKIKVSKAQKRRDKKMLLERERDEQIKLQEKQNVNGPRNLEMQALNARLKDKNLIIYQIPSDGDCLYKAVAHQLQIKHDKSVSIDYLRNSAASFIQENRDDFFPFLSNPKTNEMLTDKEFDEYCNKIRTTKVWGGQLEIRALSNFLKCPITVIQAEGPETIEQGTEFLEPTLFLAYHRHMYKLGEHYNSTQPFMPINE